MPTSGTRRGSRPAAGSGGFTLLELVVVLALLGLATALVAPSGMRAIEARSRNADIEAGLGSLSALAARAHEQGRAMVLAAGELPAGAIEGLPEGWIVTLEQPLRIQANGACSHSRGELRDETGYVQPFEVAAPFCDTTRTGLGGG